METLHYRLTGQFWRIKTREKTAEAEATLSLNRCTYFYVGRAHPHYGELITIHSHPKELASVWAVSPFDSGGLAHNHIATLPPLLDEEKAAFVERWSWADTSYEPMMERWIGDSFAEPSGYTGTVTPKGLIVSEIDLASCHDHAWTWEGRLEARRTDANPAPPEKVYLSPGRRQNYLEWLRSEKRLTPAEYAVHLQLVAIVVFEADNPIDLATEHLTSYRREG